METLSETISEILTPFKDEKDFIFNHMSPVLWRNYSNKTKFSIYIPKMTFEEYETRRLIILSNGWWYKGQWDPKEDIPAGKGLYLSPIKGYTQTAIESFSQDDSEFTYHVFFIDKDKTHFKFEEIAFRPSPRKFISLDPKEEDFAFLI
jgi:hypothetical protein